MLIRISSILLLFFIPVSAFAQFADNTPAFAVIRPSGAGRVVHILDIVLKDNIAYAVGTGGLWTINVANISSPNQLGAFRPRGQIYGAALNGDYLYTFMRTNGMDVMNVSNPSSPSRTRNVLHNGDDSYERGVVDGNTLYVAAHNNGVRVFDISSPCNPQYVTTVSMDNAFALAKSGDYLCVADGSAGLSIVDISNPSSPVLMTTLETNALAQDVQVSGNYAYVAVGSAGMDIFDISNPQQPTFVSNYHVDGFSNRLSIADGFAYLANWQTIEVVDISDPSHPQLIATQHSFERAMTVAAENNTFFVGDWSAFRIYQFENFPVPDVNVDPLNLSFGTIELGNSQSLTFRVENVGQEPLTVTELEAVGSGFSVESASFTLNPFEDREFTATYTPVSNNDNASGFINIKSNDPDEPEKILPVSGGNRVVGVGDVPTDFTLVDFQGQSFNLQDHINQGLIVVLAFYASW